MPDSSCANAKTILGGASAVHTHKNRDFGMICNGAKLLRADFWSGQSRIRYVFTLYRIAFAPARKPYWVGLLPFTHIRTVISGWSLTERNCSVPIFFLSATCYRLKAFLVLPTWSKWRSLINCQCNRNDCSKHVHMWFCWKMGKIFIYTKSHQRCNTKSKKEKEKSNGN